MLADLRGRGLSEETLARVRSPAGLDLGPSTQEEIAVAILAELVAWRHVRPDAPEESPRAEELIDPVCGMTVSADATETALYEGRTYAFCGAGCRRRFEADPAGYVASSRPTAST